MIIRIPDPRSIIFLLLPRTFHGFFTTVGMLFLLIGIFYNVLEDKLLFGSGDACILIGLFLIQLAILSFLIKNLLRN